MYHAVVVISGYSYISYRLPEELDKAFTRLYKTNRDDYCYPNNVDESQNHVEGKKPSKDFMSYDSIDIRR